MESRRRSLQAASGLLLALALLAPALEPAHADPEADRQQFLAVYAERFPGIPVRDYVYGALIASPDARAQYEQIMDFPPFLTEVDRGRALWEMPLADDSHLADCFPNAARGQAGRYPRLDADGASLMTFEMAINRCRERAGNVPWPYATGPMALATAYARGLSDAMLMDVSVQGTAALAHYERGKALFFRRMGPLNFACASCHLQNAGRILRTEILSPAIGQATHWPVFRGGETLTTLQGRYRRCMEQIRVVPFAPGSEEMNDLEYFHSYLSNGLPLQASVFRK